MMDKIREVVIFGRKGCHLCETVEAEIRSIKEIKISLTVVDIDRDPALQAKYLTRVPVVVVGGRETFEAKMMDIEGEWKEKLIATLALAEDFSRRQP